MLGSVKLSQKSYQTYDTAHLRAAGLTHGMNESASQCLTWQERPSTPDGLKKYRQSTLHTPGQIFRHFGAADDHVDTERVYGREGDKVDSLAKCLKTYPESDMMRWTLDRSEDVYHSSTREPLGRSWVRGHQLPPGMGTEVPFGKRIDAKKNSAISLARDAIAPVSAEYEDADEPGTSAHQLYVRSHGSYAPGEQRRRPYDWEATGVDPSNFRFGAVDAVDLHNGVGKALNPMLDEATAHSTQIVGKAVEDFKLVNSEVLGKSRKLGGGDRPQLPEDHAYGKPSLPKVPEDGVEKLIGGYYTQAETKPDADLGKSLREGYRNIAPPGRTFGVPSVRTDLPLPKGTSVANTLNYGNEPDAFMLLTPCSTADRGVNEQHYIARKSKDDIATLVKAAGIQMEDAAFDACFDASVKADNDEEGKTSLKTFMDVRHFMLHKLAGL